MTALYSGLKLFRYVDRIDAIGRNEAPAPVHVRIKPTNVCNHACWFCAYRADGLQLGEGMVERDRLSRDKMLEIADDMVEMGVAAVTFSGGGEPTIYPHFVDAVERLGAGGIRIGVLTNGSMLRGKVADALVRHATWVRVSIDGWDDDSYRKIRSTRPGEFERVMGNLAGFSQQLQAAGSACELGASIIVGQDNAGHVGELAAALKAAGVRHAKISPCIVSNDGVENNAYHDAIRDQVAGQISEMQETLADRRFAVIDHYHRLPDQFAPQGHRCRIAEMVTVIGADSMVYACQDKAYTDAGALGSIRERRFRDFWNSPECRAALAAIDPSRMCRHHCVARGKNAMLDEYLALAEGHREFV